jgi:hypothetical protein
MKKELKKIIIKFLNQDKNLNMIKRMWNRNVYYNR